MGKVVAFFPLLPALVSHAAEPAFVPESGASAHPIVAAIKLVGMALTAGFVIYWVVKSVRVVKHDEDDRVQLPD